jgi:hypothetical protein
MNTQNQKSILKNLINYKLDSFFNTIEGEIKNTVAKSNDKFEDLINDLNKLSIRLGRFNKTEKRSFKSVLLEKVIDFKIEKIKEVQERYPESKVEEECFNNLYYKDDLEDAFYENNPGCLINEYVLSDIDVDLVEANCNYETVYRIDDLFDKILVESDVHDTLAYFSR